MSTPHCQKFVRIELEEETLPNLYYIVGADAHLKKSLYEIGPNLYLTYCPNLGKMTDTLVNAGVLSKVFDYAIPEAWSQNEYNETGIFPRAVWEYPETGEYHFGGRPRYYTELEREYKNLVLNAKIKSVELEA